MNALDHWDGSTLSRIVDRGGAIGLYSLLEKVPDKKKLSVGTGSDMIEPIHAILISHLEESRGSIERFVDVQYLQMVS